MEKEILFEGMDDLIEGDCIDDNIYERDKELFKRMGELGFWNTRGCFATTYLDFIKDYIRIYTCENHTAYRLYIPEKFITEDFEEGCFVPIGNVISNADELTSLYLNLVNGKNKEIRDVKKVIFTDVYEDLRREYACIKYEVNRIEKAKNIQEIQLILNKETTKK